MYGRAVVRVFGQEERHVADFERHNAESQMRVMRSNSLSRTLLPLLELMIAVTIAQSSCMARARPWAAPSGWD